MKEIKVGYTRVFARNRESRARVLVNVGGSGSSKSYSLAQLIIDKFIEEREKLFIIARKTMPACKRSSYGLIIDLLHKYGIYNEEFHNKTDNIYQNGTNSIWFLGLDEPTKIKSIKEGANYIWLEEADEFTYEDYLMFRLQLRKQTSSEPNQIFLSFNPIDENGWIPSQLLHEDNIEIIHSTVEDNPFADPAYVKDLKMMAERDENFHKVYVLGEWGRLEHLIFTNYTLVDDLPEGKWCYGLDFGFVHPTALIKVLVSQEKLYWHECLCASNLTNSDLIERLTHFDRGDIYADSAEPQRIAEIIRAGYNCFPANKDVKMGIDACRRQTIHITKESVNLIKQIRGYQRQRKDGIISETPLKVFDDTMDAGRYGTMGLVGRFGFATQQPRPIETIRTLDFNYLPRYSKVVERWIRR